MQEFNIVFSIIVLIFSVVIHETAHGYMADKLGDPTARLAGRLTLNPISHLDLWGSVIIPVLFYMFGGFVFGWAKPVPYNPYNISHKYGSALVAGAGPASNLLLALVFGVLIRLAPALSLPGIVIELSIVVVLINIVLAIFNLVPIPPLDGSKILFNLLPYRYDNVRVFLERYGFLLILFFVFFLFDILYPLIEIVFGLFTGL